MNVAEQKTAHKISQFQVYDTELAARFSPDAWKMIAAFRDRPTFLDSVIVYERLFSDSFFSNPVMTMTMREAWRFQIFVMALYLHDTHDPKVPRSGLTMANLQKLCVSQKLASAGRVVEILNTLTNGGYFKRVQSSRDKRIIHFKRTALTEKMLVKWDTSVFAVIDHIIPDAGLSASYAANPDLGNAVRMAIAIMRLQNRNTIDRLPEIEFFYSKAGGWSMLARCAALTLQQPSDAPAALKLELNNLSTEFAASKSSLHRLLEAAYQQGLLAEPPVDGRNVILTNELLSTFFAWFSMFFGSHYYCAKSLQAANTGVV